MWFNPNVFPAVVALLQMCRCMHLLCVCRLGRSKTLLTSLTLSVVFGVLVCVSPYPSIFIVMRFCLAAASAGVYLTLYITREYNKNTTTTPEEKRTGFVRFAVFVC